MDSLDQAVTERLVFITRIQEIFTRLYPNSPTRLARGETQKAILEELKAPLSGWNRRIVTEAVSNLGYKMVFNEGFRFYRKK